MQVVRRHRLLETFLVEVLDLDWSEVHAEAEVLEHHLSERMVDAIDGVLGQPNEDPHGHPIPDAAGRLRERVLTPLGMLATGERGTVREVRTSGAERLQRWKELGLVPGASVRMGKRLDLEDVMHVEIGDETIVTGSEGVDGVFGRLIRRRRTRASFARALILSRLDRAPAALDAVAADLAWPHRRVRTVVDELPRDGLVARNGAALGPTRDGLAFVQAVVD